MSENINLFAKDQKNPDDATKKGVDEDSKAKIKNKLIAESFHQFSQEDLDLMQSVEIKRSNDQYLRIL